MSIKEIESEVNKINLYLKECLWMDFDFTNISVNQIKIIGSIDLCWENYHSIEIEFLNPTHISAILFEWHLLEKKPFIEIASGEEFYKKFNYENELDQHVFKINADGYNDSPIWIVAESIKSIILKQPNDGIPIKH